MPETSTFTFSPTGIQGFFEGICPARWSYGKQYKTPPSEMMELGLAVHALMETPEKVISYSGDDKAYGLAQRLVREMSAHGIRILPEYNEYAELVPLPVDKGTTFNISRRIDAIGERLDGSRIVLDWKVVMGSWKANPSGVSGKSVNFQSVSYLHSAKANAKWWPKEVWYFTINAFSRRIAVHTYAPTPAQYLEDKANLIAAAKILQHVTSNKLYPMVKGNHCGGDYPCPFTSLCYAKTQKEYKAAQATFVKNVRR